MLLRTLGGLELDGRDVKRPKALLLLAYLALEGPQERRYLAELFWLGATDPANRLSSTLTRLRKAGPDVIGADERRVWTDVPSDAQALLDAARRRDWERVLELYGGPFLAGERPDAGVELEEWIFERREFLAGHARRAGLARAEDLAARGRFEDAAGWAETALATPGAAEAEPEELARAQLLACAGHSPYAARIAEQLGEYGLEPVREAEEARRRLAGAGTSGAPAEEASTPRPPFAASSAPRGAAPFVAREEELARLDAALRTTLEGRNQVAFVVGEAGQGKTSLLQAFACRAQEAVPNLRVATGTCNGYAGVGEPFAPFREVFETMTGDVEARLARGALHPAHAERLWSDLPTTLGALLDDGPDLVQAFVEPGALLRRAGQLGAGHADVAERLRRLIAVRESAGSIAPAEQGYIFAQTTRVLQSLTRRGPLLLLVDDLQWVDAASAALLLHLGKHLGGHPVMLLGAYRPDDVAVGLDGGRHPLDRVVHELQRDLGDIVVDLRRSEGRRFVDALVDAEPNVLDEGFRASLHQLTGGHALFASELLRAMRERGELVRDGEGRWTAPASLDAVSVPARIEGIIVERVARLEPELRDLLEVAAVAGEAFDAEVVARALRRDAATVVRQLGRELDARHALVEPLGVRRAGPVRSSRYRFRHALLQRYLVQTLDEVYARSLHEAIASALREHHARRLPEVAVELARHYQRADMPAEAVAQLAVAAACAMQRTAHQDAIVHAERGLGLLARHPELPDALELELDLRAVLAPALIATRGWDSAGARDAYQRVREISEILDRPEQLSAALYGLATWHELRGEYQETQRVLGERSRVATIARHRRESVETHELMACSKFHQGSFAEALGHAEEAWHDYDPARHLALTAFLGENPGVAAHHWAALSLWFLGRPDSARERIGRALRLAGDADHVFALAHAHEQAGVLHQLLREVAAVRRHAETALALAERNGYRYRSGTATVLSGWADAAEGRAAEGALRIREGVAICASTGARIDQPYFLTMLAEAQRGAGRPAEALATLDEGLELVRASGAFFFEAEMHRLRAGILAEEAASGDRDAGLAALHLAIDTARRQNARTLLLRAATDLVRRGATTADGGDACELLREVLGGFDEGFETVDLRAAADALGGAPLGDGAPDDGATPA